MRLSTLCAPLGAILLLATAAPGFAASATLVSSASWFDGPGAKYNKVSDLPAGAHVDVLWCGLPDHWCLVQRKGVKGWLQLADLDIRKSGKVAAVDESNGKGANGATDTSSPDRHPTQSMVAQGLNPNNQNQGGGITFSPVNNYTVIKP